MNRNYGFNEYEYDDNEFDDFRYGECEFEFDMDTMLESTDGGRTNPYGLYCLRDHPAAGRIPRCISTADRLTRKSLT